MRKLEQYQPEKQKKGERTGLISVIVTVYNIREYLPKAVDSILSSTYQNLEVLLIDDGSTDGSERICDEYAKKDGRVRVVHQRNGGAYSARNTGLLEAKGDYLTFVDGDDWIEIWRKHYRPIELGNVLICPAWIERKPKEGQVEIIIDSNMAFGTGEHETTSMVISLMQNYVKNAETVIDVGTGSGILGIAAAKLGAKKVVMTDIDYVAVKSAKHNCEINGVADKCEVDLNNLLDDKNITGDLVLANITADVLLILSESIPSHVKNGGVLIMSGIIKSRVNEVIDRYSAIDFELVQRKDEGEWIALVMKKKSGAEKR